jgi:NRAMP (natural resistance-associated macrophage protein)-like metal ion transporter
MTGRADECGAGTISHREPADGTATLEAAQPNAGGPFGRFLKILGPGFITGASDDDPSGIGTYASVGAAFGFAPLWTALVSFPLMAAVQYTCAKIGMVAGTGLAGVLRRHYPRWVLYPAVFVLVTANTINAGADIGAIAAGLNLLVPIPIPAMIIPISLTILALQLWGSYRLIARVFKWLTLALFAYIGAAFFAHPDWGAVLRGTLIPTIRLDGTFLMALVAILGTTISPYLFFWQASQEVEEEEEEGRVRLWQRQGATTTELRYAGWDVGIGMFFSNLVMYFIILTTAATLHAAGQTDIASAAEAARALEPLAGRGAEALLALGLVGTGFLAVPILTGAGAYAVAEAWGWRSGLDEEPRRAKPFYGVIVGATLVGMLINFVGINPITALYWTAVLNGLLAPPLLVLIMLIANNRSVMGERTNGRALNVLGWATTLAMAAAALGLLVSWL